MTRKPGIFIPKMNNSVEKLWKGVDKYVGASIARLLIL